MGIRQQYRDLEYRHHNLNTKRKELVEKKYRIEIQLEETIETMRLLEQEIDLITTKLDDVDDPTYTDPPYQ